MSVLDELVDNVLIAARTTARTDEPWAVGVVISVVVGGAHDGFDVVTVNWRGTEVQAARLASYTPTVGHQVLMARFGPQLVVLDRIVGTPPRA